MQSFRCNGHPVRARGWIAALVAVCALVVPDASAAGQASKNGAPTAIAAAPGLGSESLPRVLSDRDAELYREIFALQEKGKWRAAGPRGSIVGPRAASGACSSWAAA